MSRAVPFLSMKMFSTGVKFNISHRNREMSVTESLTHSGKLFLTQPGIDHSVKSHLN